MRGVLLAGGLGTRLKPVTEVYNKHLALVYDKPMIYYPIQTLKGMGCTDITLVSGGEHIGGLAELLGNGSRFGVNITYRVQEKPGGIAEALGCVQDIHIKFPVILGDNYFSETLEMPAGPSIFVKQVAHPEGYGVYADHKVVEKPVRPKSNLAVTGLYVYNNLVFDFIKNIKPSARGELEITDINNLYLENKDLRVIEYKGFWGDMGTPNGLLEVANYVKI